MRLIRRPARRLRADTAGVALTEFALTLPLVLGMGIWGVELSNYAIVHLRVSQVALALADNASRVGVTSSTLAEQQLREIDINDVLQSSRLEGDTIKVSTNGRITLSSLETNSSGGQWIHWQRCLGIKSGTGWDSTYGTAGDGATGDAFKGMGPKGAEVTAPAKSGVMFVEINYEYQPLFSTLLVGKKKISYIASFIVRDRRDFAGPAGGDGVWNPAPAATASRCNAYSA